MCINRIQKGQWRKIVILFFKSGQRIFSMFDLITDVVLFVAFQEAEYIFLTVPLFISICAPYLISYSSGVKLFMTRGAFDNSHGLLKILTSIFLSPIGVWYFVLIDVLDALVVLFDLLSMAFFGMTDDDVKQRHRLLAKQIGLDRMSYEGFKRQRRVGQLLFEV